MVRVAVLAPALVGRKMTPIWQISPAARVTPAQLEPVRMNSALLTDRLLMVKVAAPVFWMVSDCTALAVPTCWFPKSSAVGDTVSAPVTPVPVRLTVWIGLAPPEVCQASLTRKSADAKPG